MYRYPPQPVPHAQTPAFQALTVSGTPAPRPASVGRASADSTAAAAAGLDFAPRPDHYPPQTAPTTMEHHHLHPDQAGPGPESGGPNSRAAAAAAAMKPIRRRNRMINSCLECRKRKLKCSKTSPACMNCLKSGRDCLYIGPKLDEASQLRLAEIKEKQGSLERQLERDVAKSTTTKSALQQRILADEVEDDYDEDRDLEATPLVALDMTYEDDADGGTDEMIDLGIQIGKMRITERIGGLSRPRLSEEVCARSAAAYTARTHGC